METSHNPDNSLIVVKHAWLNLLSSQKEDSAMNNIRRSWFLMVLFAAVFTTHGAMAQKNDQAEVLLQAAQHKQLVEGDLKGAIKIYNQIVASYGNNHAVAAKALVQMGRCYEKMGNAEARKAYDRVVRDYNDQREMVAEARARLSSLTPAASRAAAVAKATGPTIRQVWAGPGAYYGGTPSPDGRYLSFVLPPPDGHPYMDDVAVRDLATGEIRRVTNFGPDAKEDADMMIWSPDGKQLAYSCEPWSDPDIQSELHVIGLDGSKPRLLYRHKDTTHLDPVVWSPDGKHILADFWQRDGTRQIVWVAVADGSVQIIKKLEERLGHISLSPDGRYLVYDVDVRKDFAKRDIFLLTADGNRETPLIQSPADDQLLGWAPDGKTILFASDRSGIWDAWSISVVEGKVQGSPERVKREIGHVFPMGFTRNGSFYYFVNTELTDVYLATLDPETGKLVSPPKLASNRYTGSNEQPAWSPDGQYLIYKSTRGVRGFAGSGIISILSIDTGQQREVAPQMSGFRYPFFSPEGQLVVLGPTGRGLDWFKIDEQTGVASPYVLPPSRWVFSPSSDSIKARNPDTGEEKIVYRAPQPINRNLAVGWRGQRMAFVLGNALMVVRADGVARELLRLKESERFYGSRTIQWTPDGRYILFVKQANEKAPCELWRIPAEGGQAQNLGVAMEELDELRVHPDGRRLAFMAGKKDAGEVWVMENFLPAAQNRKASVAKRSH
jgi:Tol biopolymer transport system component